MTAVSELHPTRPTTSLALLVQTQQAGIWRYLRYLGAKDDEAEDLTQETFLALARSTFTERSSAETSAFLRTIARNQLLMLRRKQQREISTVALEAAEQVWSAAAPHDGLEEYLDTLRDCVASLEGRSQQVIDLHYRQHLSREAIAAELELQPEGVKTLLRRVRDALRTCVERKLHSESVLS